jgi:hypothetical protein
MTATIHVLGDDRSPSLDHLVQLVAVDMNGVVRNMDAWYKAFNVQPGDKLYLAPNQRVHIW